MLDSIRSFLGADGALLLDWRTEDVASVLCASPETPAERSVRLSRAALIPHDGQILVDSLPQQLLGNALADWSSMPIRAACVCSAPVRAGQEKPSGALIVFWHERSAATQERLAELRPLCTAFVETAVAQQNALRAVRRLDAIMGSAPYGIVFVDDDYGDADVNDEAARLLGVPRGVVSAERLNDAFRSLHTRLVHRENVVAEYARLSTSLDDSVRDWIWEFADSAGTAFRVASIPVIGAAGRGRLWTFEDVSSERQMHRQVERQHERERLLQRQRLDAVTQLAAGVAHDFNNILTVIGGSVEILREPSSPGEGDVEVAMIRQAARRGHGLIKQLLSFSGQVLAQPTMLDVDGLLRKIEPLLADALEASWSLSIRPDAIDARVLIDERQLTLALVNLLSTASETVSNGGVITVRSARVSSATGAPSDGQQPIRWVAIALSDVDAPIPSTVRENLQESFAGLRTDSGRAGFGLETIAAMVEQAGGTIRYTAATSTAAGPRWTYTLYLREADTRPSYQRQPTPARGVPISSDITELPILVVDDDAGPRRVVRRLLEREGHAVLTAESAAEALRLLETHNGQFLGVISDYLMPGMSGMELLTQIRAQWPDLPVVLVSGFTSDNVTGSALRDLRAHFLAKPFTRDELLTAVRTARAVARGV